MTEIFDVIVIGAGASGLSSSWRLSEYGIKVGCFEKGDYLDDSDIIDIQDGGEIQKYSDLSFDPNVRKLESDYYIDSTDSQIHLANFSGVGGSTVLFSAQYPRFHQSDFKIFSNEGVGADWPILYRDLKKYYEIDQKITGVSGLEGDPFYPDISNLMPPVPLGPMGIKLKNAFNSLGWHCWPAYSAINTVPYLGRPADNYLRPSNLGDITGSKGSADKTYLPRAINNGLIMKTNCNVVKIETCSNKVHSIKYLDQNNSPREAKAKIYLLAASGVGTPRLLLHSRNSENKKGIANSSGLVGKNLMLHPLGYIEGHFKENLFSSVGPQGCCLLSQEFYETRKEHEFKRGYTFQVLRGPLPIESATSLLARKMLKLGTKNFLGEFLSKYDHTAHMTVITEDFPEISNKVELNYQTKDKSGMPGISVKYKMSENTKKMLSHGLSKGRILFKEAGAQKTFAFGPVKNTGWHIMGTCKMGDNPNESVVNKFGKCHDLENLFISDSSIFSSSAGVNPASTINALSIYIADYIYEKFKNNEA